MFIFVEIIRNRKSLLITLHEIDIVPNTKNDAKEMLNNQVFVLVPLRLTPVLT